MVKGFGSPKKGHLGYVLLLLQEAKAYAADFSLGRTDEEFIGITNSLEHAQVWRKKDDLGDDLIKYGGIVIEQFEEKEQVEISICSLKRLSNGKLKAQPEEGFVFEKTSKPENLDLL